MKIQSKWVIFLYSLLILFLLVQACSFFILKVSPVLASFLSLCLIIPGQESGN